jgi:hypothetical protein
MRAKPQRRNPDFQGIFRILAGPDQVQEFGHDHRGGTPDLVASKVVEGHAHIHAPERPDFLLDIFLVQKMIKRDLEDLGDFVGGRLEIRPAFGCGDNRIDAVIARRDVKRGEFAENAGRRRRDIEFLLGLPEGCFQDGLVAVLVPPGKRDLRLMMSDLVGPAGQDDMEAAVLGIQENKDAGLIAGIPGLQISIVGAPVFGNHLELGGQSGLGGPEPPLKGF